MKRILALSILLAALNCSMLISYSAAKYKTHSEEIMEPNYHMTKTQNGETNATVTEDGICPVCFRQNTNPPITKNTNTLPVIIGAELKQEQIEVKPKRIRGTN